MRKSELIGDLAYQIEPLTWDRVDLDAGTLRVFKKTQKKGVQLRTVYCCTSAVEILSSLPKMDGNPYVIPGRLKGKPMVGLQGYWERLREAAGLAIKGKPSEEDPGFHDLRRTFGSVGADIGLKHFMGDLLGHAEQTVTDIYTRSATERLADAAEEVGSRIYGILSGQIDPEEEAEARRKLKAKKKKIASKNRDVESH